jgi:hypothetical protein
MFCCCHCCYYSNNFNAFSTVWKLLSEHSKKARKLVKQIYRTGCHVPRMIGPLRYLRLQQKVHYHHHLHLRHRRHYHLLHSWFFEDFFSFGATTPMLGLGLHPRNSPFHFGLLDLTHSVGLLGRVISSSQGLYLYRNTEKRTYTNTKHPCPEWGSNKRSRLPSERRQCTP